MKAIRYDCDGDALLALVEPAGPACHTGERTCFHRGELEPGAPYEVLPTLERTIAERARARPEGSYTATLLDDPARAGAKVEEEAEEVVARAREESDERVAEEAADVLYHLAVLLRGRGLTLADAERVLDGRRQPLSAIAAGVPSLDGRARRSRRPQPDPAARDVHRRLPDAGVGVPQAPRRRARRSCSSRPTRARRALLVHRLPPAQGAALVARRRRRSVRARGRRARPVPRRAPARPAAVRRRRRRRVRATTSCARSSRSASRTPTRSGCRTWR